MKESHLAETRYDDDADDGGNEEQEEDNNTTVISASSSSSSSSSSPCIWSPAFNGKVLFGTCGWTDASILKSHRFYPSSVHTAIDRLKHYSSHFPCVEVDSSNYAVPPINRIKSWLEQVPSTFLFHFKVFGLFTSLQIRPDAIPGALRHLLPNSTGNVLYSSLSESFIASLWNYWNQCILPAHNANKLGLVIFQFQLSFSPSLSNKQHIRNCRSGLDSRYRMGVEFRDRKWIQTKEQLLETLAFLQELDITFICEDDLEEETYRFSTGSNRLPIVYTTSSTHSYYIRLHRRIGDNRGDRVLLPGEFVEWAQRLKQQKQNSAERNGDQRVIFFLFGTDCYDDPIVNIKTMEKHLKLLDEPGKDEKEQQKETKQDIGINHQLVIKTSATTSSPASLYLDWPSLAGTGQKSTLVSLFRQQREKQHPPVSKLQASIKIKEEEQLPQDDQDIVEEQRMEEKMQSRPQSSSSSFISPTDASDPISYRQDSDIEGIRSPLLTERIPAKKRKATSPSVKDKDVKNNKSITAFFSPKRPNTNSK